MSARSVFITLLALATLVLGGCPDEGDDDTSVADDDTGLTDCLYYRDADDDGYGDPEEEALRSCDGPPNGFVDNAEDCDDTDTLVNPGAEEICDGIDNDCDGFLPNDEADEDGDDQMACEGDCNDSDPSIGMDFFESCDGVDSNCDGSIDDELVDADGDGQTLCLGDCDDADANVYLGAPDDSCDGIDSNCLGDVEYLVPADFPRIQDAIDAISGGGEVCVFPGTYVENLDFQGKVIRVIGIEGSDNTIIDGGQAGSVVRMDNYGGGSKLKGLTLTNGYSAYGGGAYLYDHCSPTLTDVSFTGNSADLGGGMYLEDHCSPTLTDVSLTDNSAPSGGGMYLENHCSPTLTNVTFRDNSATSWSGGGIYMYWDSSPTLANVTFTGNTALTDGGAINMASDSSPVIDTTTFLNNSAGSEGGAMYLHDSGAVMTNVVLSGNSATTGGGMAIAASGPLLTNVIISGNSASGSGGGMYLWDSSATLTNVAIVGNSGGNEGGGMTVSGAWVDPLSGSTFTNVVVSENSASYGGGVFWNAYSPFPPFLYTNVYGNTPDDYDGITDPTGTIGNISVEPEFLDTTAPDPLDWDLHLAITSPLIDAGDPSILDPDGSPSDIGAYGGPGAATWDLDWDGYFEWWLPGPYDPATSPGMDCDDMDYGVYPGQGC